MRCSCLQKILTDPRISAFRLYQQLAIGQSGLGSFVQYELITGLFGGFPGAAGFLFRKLYYPKLVKSCGKTVIWGRNVLIRHGHKIHIGDGVVLDDNVVLDAKGVNNAGIILENNVSISRGTILSCKDGDICVCKDSSLGIYCVVHAVNGSNVLIGPDTVIAAFVYLIGGGNYHFESLDTPIKNQGTYSRGGIEIAGNVWIGAKVQILDGVHVGFGSVIAAGATVHRDVASNCLVGGVPARILKQR